MSDDVEKLRMNAAFSNGGALLFTSVAAGAITNMDDGETMDLHVFTEGLVADRAYACEQQAIQCDLEGYRAYLNHQADLGEGAISWIAVALAVSGAYLASKAYNTYQNAIGNSVAPRL